MPPRPPPSPPILTALSVVSALVAGWLAVAAEAGASYALGLVAGAPPAELRLGPPTYTMTVFMLGDDTTTPGQAVMILVLPAVALLATALVVQAVVRGLRVAGWLRSLVLSFHVVGLLWLPTVLVAGGLPEGGGPIGMLYDTLGSPQAGRWAAVALGTLLLVVLAGVVSRQAVATGRSWMRADGVDFRRRLVRVVAGYPGAAALAALAVLLGWMPMAVALVWGGVLLVTLVVRTA